jgi:hypothetical protein
MFGKRTYPKASVTLKLPNRPELSTGNKIRTNTNPTLREREREKEGKRNKLKKKNTFMFFFWGFCFCPKATVLREQRRKRQSLSGQQLIS